MSKGSNRSRIMLRFGIISALILLFSSLIVAKLFSTTIVHAEKWNTKANAELQRTDTIQPMRGEILASDGTVLVTNLCYYNVRIDFGSEAFAKQEFLNNVGALSDSLAAYFPYRTSQEWNNVLMKEFNREKKSRSFRLLKLINYAQLEKVRTFPFLNLPNHYKSGMIEESVMRRDYPYGSMARRSIGRTGQTAQCKEVHGISGLECALDSLLFGTPGIYKRVPFTKRIGNWTDVPAVNGYNITTTIDIAMQDILEQELNAMLDSCGAEWATAILMEVSTGDIKALANLELCDGKYIEAYNRSCVAYEPGSVVKTISMMFALEEGLVNNIDSVIHIGSNFPYGGGRPITDSHYIGETTVAGVIEQSSNIGMARIITNPRGPFDRNPEEFVKRFENIGFFEPLKFGVAHEERPVINRHPTRLDMSRMCFGYTTAIPPIYTLSVYNAIANGGVYVKPRLMKAMSRDGVDSIVPVAYIRERICSEENAAKLRQMLRRVVDGDHGTGRRLRNPYVSLAGKTGTCYAIDTVTKGYDHSKKRLAFCGFFPADNPKYSMMVLTFHPVRNLLGAASTSGEVMKNMALKLYSRGMLDNETDYNEYIPANRSGAYIHTSHNPTNTLRSSLGKDNKVYARTAPSKSTTPSGMPVVTDMSLREAVETLEKSGYEVNFTGTGRVVAQVLNPETKTVKLTLSTSHR